MYYSISLYTPHLVLYLTKLLYVTHSFTLLAYRYQELVNVVLYMPLIPQVRLRF
jgi:hypothetical protein